MKVTMVPDPLALLNFLFVAIFFGTHHAWADDIHNTAPPSPTPISSSSSSDTFTGWTCDELTPDLCNLPPPEVGSVTVRSGIQVRYWIYRNDPLLSSVQGENPSTWPKHDNIPIIVIHGGPSFPHNYMLPHRQLACRGYEVIFYDQAGCGESSLPVSGNTSVKETFPWLLDPEYYAHEELPTLISNLGITEYHLLCHSWGSIVCQLHALGKSTSSGLKSMVLGAPVSDMTLYNKVQAQSSDGTLALLPPFIASRIEAFINADGDAYDSPEYNALHEIFTSQFFVRTYPFPDCLGESFANINVEIPSRLWGPSETHVPPYALLYGWDITSRLHEIHIPVLITSARYDFFRPEIVSVVFENLPISEWVIFETSGHCTSIDDPGLVNDVVDDFYMRVEENWKTETSLFTLEDKLANYAGVGMTRMEHIAKSTISSAAGSMIGPTKSGDGTGRGDGEILFGFKSILAACFFVGTFFGGVFVMQMNNARRYRYESIPT